jgi:hypothetical protein
MRSTLLQKKVVLKHGFNTTLPTSYLLIKTLPVISFGISNPISESSVGATSAKTPLLNVRFLSLLT